MRLAAHKCSTWNGGAKWHFQGVTIQGKNSSGITPKQSIRMLQLFRK